MSASEALRAKERLVALAAEGAIDQICEAHGVVLLSVFGSAAREGGDAEDLDVGATFAGEADPVGLLDDLVAATGFDGIDLAVLDAAGPVLRAEALTGIPLYERERGQFARAQMAALAECRDTAWLRRLSLEALAG